MQTSLPKFHRPDVIDKRVFKPFSLKTKFGEAVALNRDNGPAPRPVFNPENPDAFVLPRPPFNVKAPNGGSANDIFY